MSKYLTYREDKTSPHVYINNPGIGWETSSIATTNPYTITSNTADLSGSITLDGVYSSITGCTDAAKVDVEKSISSAIKTSIEPKEKKAYAAAKLDDNSDEGGYSCLTAYVPRPTIK